MDESDKKLAQTEQGVATQQGNLPAQNSQPGEQAEEAQGKQPQYVTVDDLARREEELIRRVKQSDRDRARKIEGELQTIKSLLEKPGVQLTPQQEQALRNEVADRIEQEEGDFTQPGNDGKYNHAPEGNDPVADFVGGVFAETGTTVSKSDPEWAKIQSVIDATWNDPSPAAAARVVAAATKASIDKASRLAANQETAAARVGGHGAPVSGNGPNNPNAPASDYWKAAYRK